MEKFKAPVQTLENLEMKKTLIAIAALAATSAFAQSSVTLSGNLDFAYGSAKVGTAAAENTISTRDITSTTSVIKITAVEDLGNGTKATVQYGIDPRKLARDQSMDAAPDGQKNGQFASDETFVGMAGAMGNVRLGSPNSIGLSTFGASTPFGTGIGGGYAANHLGHVTGIRYARSVRYDSPTFSGLTVSVLKAQGADAKVTQPVGTIGSTTANDVVVGASDKTEMGLAYANGPLNIAYANVKVADYTASTGLQKARSSNTLAANYKLGATTLYVGMTSGDLMTDTSAVKTQKGSSIAAKHTMGKIDLMAGISQRKDSDASKTQKVTGLRADYNFSKTTATYIGYENFKATTAANDHKLVSVGLRKSF